MSDQRRASCAVTPAGCLLWVGVGLLAVWVVSAVVLWVTR